tara:strand:- start:976 stop:1785 length:810 start_codon:yes stop_codon:yes gene_type:complete
MYNITCPVYCICLPNRKENTELFFNALGLTPIYTDIVLKDSLDRHSLIESEHITANYDFNKHRGRIACNLSHKNALLEFKKSQEPYCIIFEDDNKIPTHEESIKINRILQDILPLKIWNLINLGPCWTKCLDQKSVEQYPNLKYPIKSRCRNAYAITQEGATQYLNQMFPLTPKQYAGDHILIKIHKGYDYRAPLFFQNYLNIKTTIGNNDDKRECDYRHEKGHSKYMENYTLSYNKDKSSNKCKKPFFIIFFILILLICVILFLQRKK